jgi:predicted PurR-regulated permease PerM
MLGATTTYPLLDVFWTMLEIFLFVIFIFLLFWIFVDIFRSHDMSGWAKALWVIFIILLPLIGILVYLIARGGSMHERSSQQAAQQKQAFDEYVRQTADSPSSADELSKLADLKASGAISEEEFTQAKAKILSS